MGNEIPGSSAARALAPAPPDSADVRCARGRKSPRAIAWFGFTSFWGHLRHLLATAIATDSVDSRKWMVPGSPKQLLGRAIAVLKARGAREADTLAAALGGEVWIDFVADTGDDVTVSEAVARLLVAEYEVDDPDGPGKLLLPRGSVLMLGGDLAYPVATVREMTRRLVEPWNRVLEAEGDCATPRVLLAIPGNHDWYDGLDGFARLCQAPLAFEEPTNRDEALHPRPEENPVLAWAEAFANGESVKKPGALALAGYVPVQHASYFRLPLARGLAMFGLDRQLRRVDDRQRAYFKSKRGESRVVVLPDPARAWGEDRPNGMATLAALNIDPLRAPTLVMAGDTHHYERSRQGPSVHVVAGGGGAFLQGARMRRSGASYPRDVEFPGPRASWTLCKRLPWHVASGGSGFVITSLFALGDAAALVAYFRDGLHGSVIAAAVMCCIVSLSSGLLIGWRRRNTAILLAFALTFGAMVSALPIALGVAVDVAGVDEIGGTATGRALAVAVALMISVFASGFLFGAVLAVIARQGLNHAQPFAALGAPGFKHFVRMRVTEQTSERAARIDVFVVGMVDPVGGSEPVLVDRFRWP